MKLVISPELIDPSESIESQRSQIVVAPIVTGYSQDGHSAEATDPGHPAHAYFQERYRIVRESVERALSDLATQGRLADGVDPTAAARDVVALMDGLQVQWLLDRTAFDMAESLHRHLSSLLRSHDDLD